jgi:hypothetical protein
VEQTTNRYGLACHDFHLQQEKHFKKARKMPGYLFQEFTDRDWKINRLLSDRPVYFRGFGKEKASECWPLDLVAMGGLEPPTPAL